MYSVNQSLMSENYRKEQVSNAYLAALAAGDGYIVQSGPQPDTDSVDATIRSGSSRRNMIDIQLKATARPKIRNGCLHFRLKKKNYNDLVRQRHVPTILIVLELPRCNSDWLCCTFEELIIRKCGWW